MHALSSPSQLLSKHTIRYARHHNTRRFQSGFSLLELVVVMGILAIFASVSLTFVGEKDVQQRYQQSIEKLQAVKRNFFSVDKFQGQTVMHGFFVDNGMDVEQSFKTILNTWIAIDPNDTTNDVIYIAPSKNTYLPFGLIDVYIEDIEDKINGARLYKGIRPGAYDLSEYQDSNNDIKDAWGDVFRLQPNSIEIDKEDKDYKNLSSAKNSIGINYNDLFISASFIKVYVKNLPSTGDFKVAIASFKNSEACGAQSQDAIKSCWLTTLSENIFVLKEVTSSGDTFNASNDLITNISPSVNQKLTDIQFTDKNSNTWELLEKTSLVASSITNESTFTFAELIFSGDDFNHVTDEIQNISPSVNSSNSEKITELTFTDEDDNDWKLVAQESSESEPFIFSSSDLNIGTHVVVLLEKDPTEGWVLHDTNGRHIFEYLHIFPGQIPEPITLSIP